MEVSGKVNQLRRKLMQRLTKNVGRSNIGAGFEIGGPHEINRVLICRPNHRLGNLLLVTPLIQELADTFPRAKVDLFVKGGIAPIIFGHYDNVDRIIMLPQKPFSNPFRYVAGWSRLKNRRYDIAINVDGKSSSGRLSTRLASAAYKFYGDETETNPRSPDARHIAKRPVYALRSGLKKLGLRVARRTMPGLNLKLTRNERSKGKEILKKIIGNNKKTIALFTYATGRKCYSEQWWSSFYKKLRAEYRGYNIIEILPVENVSKIGFRAPTFYSKDIREIASVIAGTDVFIGADSGIMHLASAAQTPTIGLFSVTDQTKYKPYNERSIAVDTNKTTPNGLIRILNKILGRPTEAPHGHTERWQRQFS
jgi:ADP-heptose:LPS heptosyltransferase